MKTVAEVANEIGVSKTAVRKKIAELNLQQSLKYEKNRVILTAAQERKIKGAFRKYNTFSGTFTTPECEPVAKTPETDQKPNEEPKENGSQEEIRIHCPSDMVPGLVDVLQQQLSEKDKQIDNLFDQIHELHAQMQEFNERLKDAMNLTDQQQKLQLHQAQFLTSGGSASEPIDAEEAEEEEDGDRAESDTDTEPSAEDETEPEAETPSEEKAEEEAPAEPAPPASDQAEDQPKKKSFWSRLFGF